MISPASPVSSTEGDEPPATSKSSPSSSDSRARALTFWFHFPMMLDYQKGRNRFLNVRRKFDGSIFIVGDFSSKSPPNLGFAKCSVRFRTGHRPPGTSPASVTKSLNDVDRYHGSCAWITPRPLQLRASVSSILGCLPLLLFDIFLRGYFKPLVLQNTFHKPHSQLLAL